MPFWCLQTGNYCPRHMPGEMFMFPHYSGYGLKPKQNLLFWRKILSIWTRCALLLQENYNNGNSTSLSLRFSCAICACHWPPLLMPTIPSVSHSCNCLPRSLTGVHHVMGPMSKGTSQLHVPRHSLTPPSHCDLLCPVWGPAITPSHSLGDKTAAGSAWGVPQLHWPRQGLSAQERWCEMVDATCQQLRAFKSSNTSAPFHLCPSPSPSFLSHSVAALEVFWFPDEIVQLANPANSYFHFLQLQLSASAVMGTHSPLGQTDTSAGVQSGERSYSREWGQQMTWEIGSGIAPFQQQWAAVFVTLSHLA